MTRSVTPYPQLNNQDGTPRPQPERGACTCRTYEPWPDEDCPIHGLEAFYERQDREKHGGCTCSEHNAHLTDLRNWRPDPDCPRHGQDAPQLDIDTSYTREEP